MTFQTWLIAFPIAAVAVVIALAFAGEFKNFKQRGKNA